jgi:hypothetical protein
MECYPVVASWFFCISTQQGSGWCWWQLVIDSVILCLMLPPRTSWHFRLQVCVRDEVGQQLYGSGTGDCDLFLNVIFTIYFYRRNVHYMEDNGCSELIGPPPPHLCVLCMTCVNECMMEGLFTVCLPECFVFETIEHTAMFFDLGGGGYPKTWRVNLILVRMSLV